MAISGTHLATDINSAATTSYNTAVINPSAGALVLLIVNSGRLNTSSSVVAPTVTGDGLTFVQVGTVLYPGTNLARHTAFRALSSATSSGSLTIEFSDQQHTCGWSVAEFSGVTTGGTNGSSAVIQALTTAGGATTQPSIALSAFAGTSNGTAGGFSGNTAHTLSIGTGFTLLGTTQDASGTPNISILSEWRSDNDVSVDCHTSGANMIWGGTAFELRAASTAASSTDNASWQITAAYA